MDYELILFDVDGTLVDSFATYVTIMESILPHFGVKANASLLRRTFAMPVVQAMQTLNIDVSRVNELERQYNNALDSVSEKEHFFNGIKEMLNDLNHIKKGIVTSRSTADIRVPEQRTMFNSMDVLITAEKSATHKPLPEPIMLAMTEIGVTPKNTIYVGDDVDDEQAAHSAGASFGLANWSNQELGKFEHPDYIFNEPKDVAIMLNH
ncbi:HAD family hydrolase [Paucilactobacillus suebicus]|uniref:Phosphoglycolate phosphatase n=1 Tax=Paucilactobacillus suebicus DSM 5007 = KCTC 3549 TaxID=1423807 RepID=A0A0R1WAD5_9LACO|nr:HAD family hydrolase [Paucilactobacillus suebicus]KRM12804.1 phosphoglycolate phosphatase [Paucilactobacillus suebicus DSM 5007 = KCTC 3549]